MKYKCIKRLLDILQVGKEYDVQSEQKYGITVYTVNGKLQLGDETLPIYLSKVEE